MADMALRRVGVAKSSENSIIAIGYFNDPLYINKA